MCAGARHQSGAVVSAFDFVSNPSTVGAFMHTAGNINESVKSDGVVTLAVRKWDNVETIIRDILSEVK